MRQSVFLEPVPGAHELVVGGSVHCAAATFDHMKMDKVVPITT